MYVPAMGHGSFLAELLFESAHQPAKRALEKAKKSRNPHNWSLHQVTFNDIQARLAMLESAARDEDVMALRGCVRFLLGQAEFEKCSDGPGPEDLLATVNRALGPEAIVSHYLDGEKGGVMSADRALVEREARCHRHPVGGRLASPGHCQCGEQCSPRLRRGGVQPPMEYPGL